MLGVLDNSSEPEKDILLAFEEQEKSGSAATPGSPAPLRHSTQLLQHEEKRHFQAENIRARTEEPRDATRVETTDEGEEDSARQQAAEGGGEGRHDEKRKTWQERGRRQRRNDSRSMKRRASWKERMKSLMSWLWKNACTMERKRMAQTILRTRTMIVTLSTRKTRTYGQQNDGDYPRHSVMRVLRTAVSTARGLMSNNPVAHYLRPLREATCSPRLCVLVLEIRQLMSNSILHILPGARSHGECARLLG
jgi:hypothetical protein